MRLFIAAYPPADVREHFGEMVARLAVARPMPPGHSTRLATPDRWHLTFAFLGDVADEQADKAADALRDLPVGAPTVQITGGGRFGRGRFTTLVADVREVELHVAVLQGGAAGMGSRRRGDLADLSDAVRNALRRRRLPFDRRPFRPHVTIARPGDRLSAAEIAADLAALKAYQGPLWTVDEVRLVRSSLGPRPQYESIGAVALTR